MKLGLICLLVQIALVLLYMLVTDYGEPYHEGATGEATLNNVVRYYPMYNHVAHMILIGFGYLMTFLRRHRFTSIAVTFWITALVCGWFFTNSSQANEVRLALRPNLAKKSFYLIQLSLVWTTIASNIILDLVYLQIFQWGLLVLGFWEKLHSGHWDSKIHLTIAGMVDGMFCVAAVLISFGGIIGRVSPHQMLFLGFFETIVYTGNFVLCYKVFKVADIGGSMVIHAFGAYFGLVCCFFFRERPWGKYPAHTSTYTGDTFAFIGTFILWLLWPSFNSALAPPTTQYRVLINTVLSLCGATLCTFSLSNYFRHGSKLTPEDLQNATLAGGVAIGTTADLFLNPGGALLLGCIAGAVSTIGYNKLGPLLQRAIGLYDTCGIHNLHGMPGIIGGLAGVVLTAIADPAAYGDSYADLFLNPLDYHWKMQFAALGTSVGLAIVGGLVIGFITKFLLGNCMGLDPKHHFEDFEFFETSPKHSHETWQAELETLHANDA